MFQSHVSWTYQKAPEAASAALIGKPENPQNAVSVVGVIPLRVDVR